MGSPLKMLGKSHFESENWKNKYFCVSQIWFYYYILNENFWLFLAFSKQSKQKCWIFSNLDQRHDGFHTGFHTKWWISIDFAMKRWNFFIFWLLKTAPTLWKLTRFGRSTPRWKGLGLKRAKTGFIIEKFLRRPPIEDHQVGRILAKSTFTTPL